MTMAAVRTSHRRTVAAVALLPALMLALGFAAVPLYRAFCQATGYGGTTQRAAQDKAPGATSRMIDVRFDANTAPKMGWYFEPEKHVQRIAVGARNMAFFEAVNNTDHVITGTATFNVTPAQSGQYFTKIQCFCFTQQTLKPGERVRMPVIYFIDPRLMDDPDARDISEITLSYTFFPVEAGKASS